MIEKKVIVLHKYGSCAVSGAVKIIRDRDKVYLDVGTAYDSTYKWYVYDGERIYSGNISQDICLERVAVLVVEGDSPIMYGTNSNLTERKTYLAYTSIQNTKKEEIKQVEEDKPPVVEPTCENDTVKRVEMPNMVREATQGNADFYRKVKRTLDEMFVCYPEEKVIENLVDDSKWIRIDSEGSYYVVGIVGGDTPEYICYGMPSTRDMLPPQELEPYCEWLPCGGDRGYWVVFQSASTGETIRKLD